MLFPQLVQNMTSADYANYIRSRISNDRTFNVSYYDPAFENSDGEGTAHASVIDQFGNAVSITSTINF